MLSLTKDQLRAVNEHRGKIDTDSGQVFDCLAGGRNPRDLSDPLYHAESQLSDPAPDHDYEKFSLSDAVGGSKPKRQRSQTTARKDAED